ncbi:MAG: hypothetical protein H0X25_16135 [Acidobacteriales bacterium]|nr:hypothetical protein [Terriglobales bacterium]
MDKQIIVRLAISLEALAARVDRDLNAEAAEGAPLEDPQWAAAIAGVVELAGECVAVLDEPEISSALFDLAL